jgi:predicted RNA binding protein with dsRBD fold (UPF0201 family)
LEASGSVTIWLHASVSPSEDPSKVLAAAKNVFPECAYEVEKVQDGFVLRSRGMACLEKIRDQLRDRHVRAAANRLILRMRDGPRLNVLLNRQAAAAGVIALCTSATESPLGPLVLQIDCDDPESVIEWLSAY